MEIASPFGPAMTEELKEFAVVLFLLLTSFLVISSLWLVAGLRMREMSTRLYLFHAEWIFQDLQEKKQGTK